MTIDKGADDFIALLYRWSDEGRRQLERAITRAVFRWHAEAVKRVPVDTGRLKNAILHNVYWAGGELIGEVGTNVRTYPDYLEFGTKRIAGGRVLALGGSPDITDAMAIHDWAAKDAETGTMQGVSIDSQGRRRAKSGRFVGGGGQEQMPWLRPAFNAIRDWATAEIQAALAPPRA